MAYDSFSLEEKISLWKQLDRRRALGPLKTQGSGERVSTEFDTSKVNLAQEIEYLMDSIRNDPLFDASNQYYDVLMGNRRPGQTIPIYTSVNRPFQEL
jgi:hypothetical protein